MYPCLNDQETYGYSILGQASGEAQRVSLTVDRIDEPGTYEWGCRPKMLTENNIKFYTTTKIMFQASGHTNRATQRLI